MNINNEVRLAVLEELLADVVLEEDFCHRHLIDLIKRDLSIVHEVTRCKDLAATQNLLRSRIQRLKVMMSHEEH